MRNLKKCLLWVFGVSTVYAILVSFIIRTFFSDSIHLVSIQFASLALYMWIPGVFGLIYRKKDGISFSLIQKPRKWLFSALVIPSVFTLLSIMFGAIFSPVKPDNFIPENSFFISLTSHYALNFTLFYIYIFAVAIVCALSINYLFALGEEILWRGYLWEKVKGLGFVRSCFSIGLIWGLWHAPSIIFLGHNYPDHRVLGIFWMIILCLLMTPILVYLNNQEKSIAPAVVFHGMFNAIAPLSFLYYDKPNSLVVTSLGLSGIIALILINIALYPSYKKTFSTKEFSKLIS